MACLHGIHHGNQKNHSKTRHTDGSASVNKMSRSFGPGVVFRFVIAVSDEYGENGAGRDSGPVIEGV